MKCSDMSAVSSSEGMFHPIRLEAIGPRIEPNKTFYAVLGVLPMAADPEQRKLFNLQRYRLQSRRDIPGPFLPATITQLQRAAEIIDRKRPNEELRTRLLQEMDAYFNPKVAMRGAHGARWHERLDTANALAQIAPELVAAYERYEQTLPYNIYSHERFVEFTEMSADDVTRNAEIIRGEVRIRQLGDRNPWLEHENDEALGQLQLRHLRILASSPTHRELLAALQEYDTAATWPSIASISVAV